MPWQASVSPTRGDIDSNEKLDLNSLKYSAAEHNSKMLLLPEEYCEHACTHAISSIRSGWHERRPPEVHLYACEHKIVQLAPLARNCTTA